MKEESIVTPSIDHKNMYKFAILVRSQIVSGAIFTRIAVVNYSPTPFSNSEPLNSQEPSSQSLSTSNEFVPLLGWEYSSFSAGLTAESTEDVCCA